MVEAPSGSAQLEQEGISGNGTDQNLNTWSFDMQSVEHS